MLFFCCLKKRQILALRPSTVQREINILKGRLCMTRFRNLTILTSLLFLVLFTGSCSLFDTAIPQELPPILAEDELIRPYVKLGRIQVTREVYGSDYMAVSDIKEWGFAAVRAEAAKMGADAVILPEVSGHTATFMVLPATEYRASGVAIRFK